MHQPIAYTYEASVHCPSCYAILSTICQEVDPKWKDRKGNSVGVVYSWDESPEHGMCCDDCGMVITEPLEASQRLDEGSDLQESAPESQTAFSNPREPAWEVSAIILQDIMRMMASPDLSIRECLALSNVAERVRAIRWNYYFA